MIREVKMYGATCDCCGGDWEHFHYGWSAMSDESSLKEELDSHDWHIADDDKCYCPDCFTIGDNDELIISKKNRK